MKSAKGNRGCKKRQRPDLFPTRSNTAKGATSSTNLKDGNEIVDADHPTFPPPASGGRAHRRPLHMPFAMACTGYLAQSPHCKDDFVVWLGCSWHGKKARCCSACLHNVPTRDATIFLLICKIHACTLHSHTPHPSHFPAVSLILHPACTERTVQSKEWLREIFRIAATHPSPRRHLLRSPVVEYTVRLNLKPKEIGALVERGCEVGRYDSRTLSAG